MNINPIINRNNSIIRKDNNIPKANPNYSGMVSFGSAKSDRAVRLLDRTIDELVAGSDLNILNKFRFHRVLDEALPSIMKPENFINKGRESKVYRISDKYVAKIKRGVYEKNAIHSYSQTTLPSKHFKGLDFYYGEPVAKIGNVEILKNATPNENHIHCGTTFHYSGLSSNDEVKYYEEVFLPKCNEVKQESFDNLARNLKKLNAITTRDIRLKKHTYVPDIINPNNLLISEGRFILVDKLEKVPYENPNSIYTMLEPLILRMTPEKQAMQNDKLLDIRKNIFRKALIASEKNNLPLDSPIKYEFADWILNNILGSKSDILEYAKQMRQQRMPLNKRLERIDEFFKN